MSGWSFAFSRRWAGYLALTIAFAVICSLLGTWQFARRAEARAEIDRIDANYDAEPRPVGDVLIGLDDYDESRKWTPVRLEGRYLEDDQLLVRNRPYGGEPGFEILTPIELADGTVFVVDRGWVPTGSLQDTPDSVPSPPSGDVVVTARLRQGEPVLDSRSTVEGSGQIATINLPQIERMLDAPVYTGAYGVLVSQQPAPEQSALLPPRPQRDEGPHLSYALQWFVFAILGFVGLGWALRQEYRTLNADDPQERERALERERRRAARSTGDAESEDAILDAAGR